MLANRVIPIYVLLMTAVVVASNVLVQYPLSGELFGIALGDLLTYGAFTYPVAFLVTDLTNRQFGPRIARRVVAAGGDGVDSLEALRSLQRAWSEPSDVEREVSAVLAMASPASGGGAPHVSDAAWGAHSSSSTPTFSSSSSHYYTRQHHKQTSKWTKTQIQMQIHVLLKILYLQLQHRNWSQLILPLLLLLLILRCLPQCCSVPPSPHQPHWHLLSHLMLILMSMNYCMNSMN